MNTSVLAETPHKCNYKGGVRQGAAWIGLRGWNNTKEQSIIALKRHEFPTQNNSNQDVRTGAPLHATVT